MKTRITFIKRSVLISIVFFNIFITSIFADSIDRSLRGDFTKQQTVKIRFEVNKRLFSFEAGKFKLQKIKKNREKIRFITDKIIPWAMMEHLKPTEVARIIVYMYHAEEAGAPFEDAEDLIPLIAKMDIPVKEFILMVQYNKETKIAGLPEGIRHAFLGTAIRKNRDGVSILAGGRGLILAQLAGLNINKVGTLLIKKLPAQGAAQGQGKIVSIVQDVLGKYAQSRDAKKIIKNLANVHNQVKEQENSPAGVKVIMAGASQADRNIKRAKILVKPIKDKRIDREKGLIPKSETKTKREWRVLHQGSLIDTIKPWLGTPYKYGNKTGKGGIDCSGFTRIVLLDKKIGVPPNVIKHGTVNQKNAGRAIKRKDLLPGDLVFFSASPKRGKITHVGLMVTPSIFSHSTSSRGVVYDKLSKKYYKQRFVIARRIFNKVIN